MKDEITPTKLLKFALLLAVPVALSGCNTGSSYNCDPNYEDCDDGYYGSSGGTYYSSGGSTTKNPTYNSDGSSSSSGVVKGSGSGSGSFKGFGSSGSHSSGG
ncbi:hypothetical protein [Paenibacillus lignilyticus]|uniref:Lipoprotein n=1 Tax=Paenibacillus lignilyticus TaxID=1172615 RepID=A0ABS5CE70_9BACL|nr:hypothetical protein [Paenibacillus lignilyticus]MBP3964140.1 hypothetical protein [Paenibacillus lignilyticus]